MYCLGLSTILFFIDKKIETSLVKSPQLSSGQRIMKAVFWLCSWFLITSHTHGFFHLPLVFC